MGAVKSKYVSLGLILLFSGAALGCASGHCRERKNDNDRVFVSKPDGSKQCSKEPGIKLEKMVEELKGIEVFRRENRHDGLLHIALCGSPTGKINVFQIKRADLPKALALGFQEEK